MLDRITDLLIAGGFIMIPLLLLSLTAMAIVLERAGFWVALHRRRRIDRVDRLSRLLRKGDRAAVLAAIRTGGSPYTRVVGTLLEDGVSDAVAVEAMERERPRLERYMLLLSTIITAAPLLGILGTVLGIIESFQILDEQTTLTDPREVSGGIASALITTAFGLVIALLALFPYMIYRGQIERSMGRLESLVASAEEGFSD